MYAWAYAMEATLSDIHDDKIRALAIATYLDPQSELTAHIDEKYRTEASKWIEKNKPFILKPKGSTSDQI
jgi:hypothetical protein